ncbi:unnamed protein product [Candidula unifasciata]|uniref:Uncharacterized protein n=1 Tax=Candidula unifasciata TaxID=100452 RepID=A0A8S3ZQ36_9EUPU|nr:unnamed protein product [Candidula unifasciata]
MPAPPRAIGHSKVLKMLDYLVESLFVTPTNTRTCGHGQQCEADYNPDKVLGLSLEQFQLLVLGLSFVAAMGWICCVACLSSSLQQSGRTTPEKSAPIYSTSRLPTDGTTELPPSSLSARIKGSLFLLLYKIRRFGTEPRCENTTRTPLANGFRRRSSSRATVTASERSLRSDCRCPQSLSRVHTRGSVTDHGQSEVSFTESLVMSQCRSRGKEGLETRSESHNGLQDARVLPNSDWKDGIHLSVEPHSDWNDDDDGTETCIEPHSHWKGDVREYTEPRSHWKEGIEASTEPPSVWSDDVDARTELHSDWKEGRKLRAKALRNWKKGTVSRTELHSDWKKSMESFSEPCYNQRNGTGYEHQPTRSMKKDRDSWFQHHEHENSEKITDQCSY